MKKAGWGLLLGIILTCFFVAPLLPKLATHLSSRQDGILVAWLIDWGSRSLITGQNFSQAPFFHPYPNTTYYSDLFWSTAVLNLPLVWLNGQQLVLNHNLHLLLGAVFIFWGQYLLGLELFKKSSAAAISAIILTFSNLHLDYMAHLHVFLIGGLPWGILFWQRFLKTNQERYLVGVTLAGLYQFLNSPFSSYLFIFALAPFLLSREARIAIRKNWHRFIPYILGAGIMLAWFYLPYLEVSRQFAYERPLRDAAHFAFGLEKFLQLELIFLLGSSSTLWHFGPKSKSKLYPFLGLIGTGAILMLGPALKYESQTLKIFDLPIPLPYAILYYVIPGIKAFRATSRWIVLLNLGFALLLGALLAHSKLKKPWLVVIAMTAVIWMLQVPLQKNFAIPTTLPPIYEVIKTRPETVLAEFPTYVWSMQADYYHEADRLLAQSTHGKKLYNGFSGFAPPERETLWHTISANLGDKEVIRHLQESEVELVLLHLKENKDYFNFKHPAYELLTCLESDCLYRLK